MKRRSTVPDPRLTPRLTPIWLCPICAEPMEKHGFCHLVCPAGHYQEVCSDLFPADVVRAIDADSPPAAKPSKTHE